jgi:hypothetical protein
MNIKLYKRGKKKIIQICIKSIFYGINYFINLYFTSFCLCTSITILEQNFSIISIIFTRIINSFTNADK